MWKRLLMGFLIVAALLTFGSVNYANASNYQVINPQATAYTSKRKVAFISGKAPAGTSITIRLYGTTDLTRKNFNLSKLPSEKDYIEIYRDTIKAGNMGYFDKQLNLVTGINKIVITFNVNGVPGRQVIILVEPKSNGSTSKGVRLTDVMPSM